MTDGSETCRCAGQPLSCEERRRNDSEAARTLARTLARLFQANQIHTLCLSKWLCAPLWPRKTDRHTVHCLIILLVPCLACHISDKATNQMGGPPLPVALNSLRLRVDGKYRPDVDVGSTGGRKTDVIKIPPPCRDAFLQRCDQRLNKCLVC